MSEPKYPSINVRLVGQDGNAFAILGRVNHAMKRAGVCQAERDLFRKEATSGDYNHLLRTVMEWVATDEDEEDEDDYDDCEDIRECPVCGEDTLDDRSAWCTTCAEEIHVCPECETAWPGELPCPECGWE